MKTATKLGLAAIAALAIASFLSASLATSLAFAVTELEEVVICKVHEDPCAAGNQLPSGTIFHGELVSGTKWVILSSLGNVECTGANFLGQTTSLLATGEITALSMTGCTLGGGESCTATTEHLNYTLNAELVAAHTSYEYLLKEKSPNGQPQWKVICGKLLVNCAFGGSNILLEALADEVNHDAVLDVLQELNRTGGICPATSTWHAKFLTRCLNPVNTLIACWPAMEGERKEEEKKEEVKELEKVVTCKVNESPCSSGNQLKEGTELKGELVAETKSVLLSSVGSVECTGSSFAGKTTSMLAISEITSLTITGCNLEATSCTATPEHLSYKLSAELTSAHTGYEYLLKEKSSNGQPQWKFVCGSLVNCAFGGSSILFEASGESDTVLSVLQELTRTGGICPATSTWHAKFLLRTTESELKGTWPKTELAEDVVLCKEDVKEGKCPQAKVVDPTSGLDVELATGTESQLLTSLGTVKCTASKASGKTTTVSPSQLEAELTSMSMEKCVIGETSCTVTPEHLSYLLLLLLNEEANYHVVMEETAGKGKPQFKVVCGSLISCTFGNAETLFSVELGEKDVNLKVAQELNRTGGICPKTSKWEATYLLRALEGGSQVGAWPGLGLVPSKTYLCKEDAAGTCPESKRYGTGTKLDAELASGTESFFLSSLGNVKCTASTIGGKTTTSGEATLEAEFESMSFSGCAVGETSCTVTPEHLGYRVLLLLNEEEKHHVIVEEKSGKGKPQFKVVCGSLISCIFGNAETLFSVELGEKDVSLKVAQELNREGSICPATSKWEATYLLRALEIVALWPRME